MVAAALTWLRLLLRSGKRLAVVGITDDLVTASNVEVQVGFAIPVAIFFKRQGDRGKVFSRPEQTRADVHLRFGGVAPRYLNHQHLPVEIERDEVAGVGGTIPMPDNGVGLIGAGVE